MERPKLAGFRNDGQAYLLTAKRALQDVKKPTVVELESVDGEIGSAGGESTHVSSDSEFTTPSPRPWNSRTMCESPMAAPTC